MTEFFDFLKHLETQSLATPPEDRPLFERAGKDRGFKTVIMACLLLSVVIQIFAASWFYDKFKMLENHLSPCPVVKPVEVDLEVAIPKLVEIDRHMGRLTQQLDDRLEIQGRFSVPETHITGEIPSTPARKEAKPRRSHQVVIVEELKN